MAERRDNLILQGLGWTITHFSRSSAVTPIITIYLIFSFFAFVMGQKEVWMILSLVILAIFLFTLWKDPDRLRSEDYNIEQKRMELGEKGKQLLETEEGVIYQPQATIPITERAGKKS